MLAVIVETEKLFDAVVYSALAGIGVTTAFSVTLWAAVRTGDLRRNGQTLLAGATAVLALLTLAAFVTGVVIGLIAMTSK